MSEVLELSHGARLAVRCPNLIPCPAAFSPDPHVAPQGPACAEENKDALLPSLGDLSELALQGGG